MADDNTIARPYAQAVFEVARENSALAELSESLASAKSLLSDGRVVEFLATPSLSDAQRLDFLQGLFAAAVGKESVFAGGNRHGTNFLKVLIENDRVGVLPEISEHFDRLKADVENTVDVTVTSASSLSKAQQVAISKALETRLGRSVRLTAELDENLIGGAVIKAGDIVIDGSLRTRLESLSNALIK